MRQNDVRKVWIMCKLNNLFYVPILVQDYPNNYTLRRHTCKLFLGEHNATSTVLKYIVSTTYSPSKHLVTCSILRP